MKGEHIATTVPCEGRAIRKERTGWQGYVGRALAAPVRMWPRRAELSIDFRTVGPGQASASSRGDRRIHGQFDQVLVRFGEPGSNRGFGITGSVPVSPDQSVSKMPFFANAAARAFPGSGALAWLVQYPRS